MVPVEDGQTSEAQTKSVNDAPSEDLASKESEDSTASAQNESVEITQQSETVSDEPEKPLPADTAGLELTESEQPSDGY